MRDFSHAYQIARQLAEMASEEMQKGLAQGVTRWTKKDAADWVTQADLRIEEKVRETIMAEFPTDSIHGEEHGILENGSNRVWFVDPIDGTCNYANHIPWSSFSLSLVVDGEPVLGVVAHPFTGEVFHALKGQGAYLGHLPIHLSHDPMQWAGQVVMMELANHEHWPGMDPTMAYLQSEKVTVRIMGSSALSIAQVAAGRAAAAVLGGSNFIDVSAAILIAQEAGAVLKSQHPEGHFGSGIGMVAAHPQLADPLWQVAFGQG